MAYDPNNPWTDAEVNALRVYYPIHGADWEGWVEVLNCRSKKAIRRKAGLLDIRHKDMRKSPERKRPAKIRREPEHRNYDYTPTPDPYEHHILKLMHEGKSLSEIDRQMHWHPNRAKQILMERWKRERCTTRQDVGRPKRFPAYTIDLEGRIRRYESWNAWRNHAMRAEGEERIYRSRLKGEFEVYETYR